MKKRKFLPIATTGKCLFAASLLFCVLGSMDLSAQMLNPPVTVENAIPPAPVPPPPPFCTSQSGGEYVNSASIDYSAFCGGCVLPSPQLTAVVADGGTILPGPPEWLYVWDQVSAWQIVPIPLPQGAAPDVIIGDNPTGIGGYQYLIGIVCTMPGAGPIVLFEYGVNGVGGGLTVSGGPISMTTIYTPTSPPYPTVAHIDGIAKYSIPYPCATCLPQCDAFAITWQDQTGNIDGYFATLSAPGTGVPISITTTGTAFMPDVAAIERLVGAVPHDIALFTYLDNSTSPISLKYVEYDITAGTLGPVTSWNNFAYSGPPRIDAIDDWTQNSTTGGNAYYDIVISAMTGGATPQDIVEYNNFSGGTQLGAPINTGMVPGGLMGQTNIYPTVACGPGPFYTVGFSTLPYLSTYIARWIDWGTGVPTTFTNAEIVPMIFPGQSIITAPLTLAASCNNDQTIGGYGPQQIFGCWNTPCGLAEKYSSIPMGFKPANIHNVKPPTKWTVSPNPATDHVILAAGEGDIKNCTYHITDMTGKDVLSGSVTSLRQQIDIQNLASGMYFINVYSGTLMTTVSKFVKD